MQLNRAMHALFAESTDSQTTDLTRARGEHLPTLAAGLARCSARGNPLGKKNSGCNSVNAGTFNGGAPATHRDEFFREQKL
jgi:hypothetical protein